MLEHLDFVQALVFFLLAALFFKEEMKPWVARIFGREPKRSLADRIDTLTKYANHETTERLDRLIAMEDEERTERQQMRDVMRDTHSLLRELKEYGVHCRQNP